MHSEKCKVCGKGIYKYGSGLYDYYSCNHAYEKPLNSTDKGRWIHYPSPYENAKLRMSK